ncbi:MAG TPA: hypothetical protein VJT72_12655 [Pseudonocardiaceae bacterium]|nr:hypothetical protein [Pseudonocardiaceae bacterium]
MSETTVDLTAARRTLRALTPRTVALVASLTNPGAPMSGSEWTVGEAAAHLIIGAKDYSGHARGVEQCYCLPRRHPGPSRRGPAALAPAIPSLHHHDLPGDPVDWLLALYGRVDWEELLQTGRVTVTDGDAALGAGLKRLLRNP